MNIKSKATFAFLWNIIDIFGGQGIQFLVTIILANLLGPKEFGIIGVVLIFINLSQTIVDGGLSQALIQKNNVSSIELSTIFWMNIFIALLVSLIIFNVAEFVSIYFGVVELTLILKVSTILIIMNSLNIVQRTILIKEINFKIQTLINLLSSIISGVIGLYFAFKGVGIWSLVILQISKASLNTLFYWYNANWKPKMEFDFFAFRSFFKFSYKLLLSSLLNTLSINFQSAFIGKVFSISTLGFYQRAEQIKDISAQNLTNIIQRLSLPILANYKDDSKLFESVFKRLLKSTSLVTFSIVIFIFGASGNIVLSFLGEEWYRTVLYLRLLCVASILYPLHVLNLNVLVIQNMTHLFLRSELIKKSLFLGNFFVGYYYGIETMLWYVVLTSFVSFFINSFWSKKIVNLNSFQQLLFVKREFQISVIIGSVTFIIDVATEQYHSHLIILLVQTTIAIVLFWIANVYMRLDSFIYIKNIINGHLVKFK